MIETGIRIESPRLDAEKVSLLTAAVCEVLEKASQCRISDAVIIATLGLFKDSCETGPINISDTHFVGDSTRNVSVP